MEELDYSAHATTVTISERCSTAATASRSTRLFSCKCSNSLKQTCNTELSTASKRLSGLIKGFWYQTLEDICALREHHSPNIFLTFPCGKRCSSYNTVYKILYGTSTEVFQNSDTRTITEPLLNHYGTITEPLQNHYGTLVIWQTSNERLSGRFVDSKSEFQSEIFVRNRSLFCFCWQSWRKKSCWLFQNFAVRNCCPTTKTQICLFSWSCYNY